MTLSARLSLPFLSASFCFLLAALLAPGTEAQELLYELVSPNEEEFGFFGSTVSGVPDTDGDGVTDLLIGAPDEDLSPILEDAGRAYLFSGATGALLHTFTSPNGEEFGHFGGSVESVTDVDGDGRGDVLVSAGDAPPGSPVNAGRAYVFSGATGALIHQLRSPNEEAEGNFGQAAGLGDVDGDGVSDLVVGAASEDPGTSPVNAGRAYVYSGATGAPLYELRSPNEEESGYFGIRVSGVPDVDRDGVGDLVVGASQEDPGTSPRDAGRAYVFSGATGALVHTLASRDEREDGSFGNVTGLSDVNGDGRGDVLVGASGERDADLPDAGRAYVFSGATGEVLHLLSSPNAETLGGFGYAVSGVTDVDGDGREDLIVGANLDGGESDPGRAYVFSGSTGTLLFELGSPNAEPQGRFGSAVSGLGDVDGDGRGDVLVGAWAEDVGPDLVNAGRAYVFSSGIGGALVVDAEPVSPPIVLPPSGGTFSYTVTTTNATATTQTVQLWTRVTRPNGQQTGALRGPITRTLAPGASVTDNLTQSIPGGIPAGTYTYTAYVGTYPNDVVASDAFTFTKQGTALAERQGDDALWSAVADQPEAAAPPDQANVLDDVPEAFALQAARPNPFAGRTTLAFDLPEAARVRLSVYDVLGREVAVLADGQRAAGHHEAVFDGSQLPAGPYLVRLTVGVSVAARRVTLVQ